MKRFLLPLALFFCAAILTSLLTSCGPAGEPASGGRHTLTLDTNIPSVVGMVDTWFLKDSNHVFQVKTNGEFIGGKIPIGHFFSRVSRTPDQTFGVTVSPDSFRFWNSSNWRRIPGAIQNFIGIDVTIMPSTDRTSGRFLVYGKSNRALTIFDVNDRRILFELEKVDAATWSYEGFPLLVSTNDSVRLFDEYGRGGIFYKKPDKTLISLAWDEKFKVGLDEEGNVWTVSEGGVYREFPLSYYGAKKIITSADPGSFYLGCDDGWIRQIRIHDDQTYNLTKLEGVQLPGPVVDMATLDDVFGFVLGLAKTKDGKNVEGSIQSLDPANLQTKTLVGPQ